MKHAPYAFVFLLVTAHASAQPSPASATTPPAEARRTDTGTPTTEAQPADTGVPTTEARPTDTGTPTTEARPTDTGTPTTEARPPDTGAPDDVAAPEMTDVPEGATNDEERPVLETAVTGYLDSRFTYQHVLTHRPLRANDLPTYSNLTEGNFQLKLRWSGGVFAFVDASFFYQRATGYYGQNAAGERVSIPDHDVPAYRPLAIASEFYVSYDITDNANITVGKKRIVWGPGFANNPTDILNPPKDPTDPSFQRAGAWLARLELPFERFTLSLVGAGKPLRQYGGLPSTLVYDASYPTWESQRDPLARFSQDHKPHYALAARLYALVADSDLNLFYYFTNVYNDAFGKKSRFGASASRYVWNTLELHFEGLGQQGSSRLFAEPECFNTGATTLAACIADGRAGRTHLNDPHWTARMLLGARYTFADESMLTLEYLYNGDGYTKTQFAALVSVLPTLQLLQAAGAPVPSITGAPVDPGTPQKFAFEPLRKHYIFLTFMKPRIHDDFTLNLVTILSAEDFSGQIAPSLAWNAQEWLTITAWGFLPLRGLPSQTVVVDGIHYSEYGIAPIDWRAIVSARAFY